MTSSSIGSSRGPFQGRPHTKQSAKDDQYLAGNSIPYALLASPESLPQTDRFTFAIPDPRDASLDQPIPGHPSYPGLPAPVNARLSLGLSAQTPSKTGPSTTIRLVAAATTPTHRDSQAYATPQLRPFATAFDLVAGTPFGKLSAWPASPTTERTAKIYPSLASLAPGPQGDGADSGEQPSGEEEDVDADADMPGTFSAPDFTPGKPAPVRASLAPPSPSPFVFGSPLPQNNVSNHGFSSVAASVLEEMNSRLAQAGVQGLSADILERKRVSDAGLAQGPVQRATGGAGGGIKNKFDRMHDGAFDKMQGIDAHYAAKRAVVPVAGSKRKSDALGPTRAVGGRNKIVPGAFGDEDEDDEGGEADNGRLRQSKKTKFEKGKRISIAAPPAAEEGEGAERTQAERDQEGARLAKEREAIKRKLELNKARRRSSMGRPSIGRGPVVPQKPKAPASRFAFLSSAKSLVQSVWGKGPTSKTAASPAAKPAVVARKPAIPASRPSTASGKPAASNRIASGGSVASTSSRTSMPIPPSGAPASSRGRRPIPSFGTPVAPVKRASFFSMGGRASGSSRFGSRSSMHSPTKASGAGGSRVSSSLGMKGGAAGAVGSMGSMGVKGPAENGSARKPASTSSRLLAPTASSLAKKQTPNIRATLSHDQGLNAVSEHQPAKADADAPRPTLSQITGHLRSPARMLSPRATKIFSQPLSPSPATPAAPTSLGAAAAALSWKPPIPPKPKVMPGRRPRVSRSKVIARLASQRVASGSSAPSASTGTSTIAPREGGKTRSSVGAQRRSYGGAKMGGPGAAGEMSAKKRARQGEFARRRSRAIGEPSGSNSGSGSRPMEVDA
ncbi:hypothetical protein FIBSPDRAFT_850243 [Athelia psychrophila]|uniref:Uncharacterized protein n=1 Tax=Athelia psychrophila TaxID=1759441 RepID=A0A166TN40_9AGAM|nr:hypothetical protein FIBSPDRAFT_850243 [Fibularhizoctonia sp. CBS 109695]